MSLVEAASALVVLGVLCKRVWLLLTSFVAPNVYGATGITLGTQTAQAGGAGMWALGGSYVPTAIEFAVVAGVVSLGALIFMVLAEKLISNKAAA